MPESTENFAEATDNETLLGTIDETLESLRIAGSVLLREAYASPWSIAIPDKDGLADLLATGRGVRVIAFHLVELGHCRLAGEGGHDILLTAGDMAICFGGTAHRLSLGPATRDIDLIDLIRKGLNPRDPYNLGVPVDTALLCGVFLLQDTVLNPLFTALPPILHTSLARVGKLHNLSGVARLITEELDRHATSGGYIVARLLEVLCAEAVRSHVASLSRSDANWLRGIRDDVVGRAIASVHRRPGDNWSVQRLAAGVSMSPSRFAARFTDLVGESPMAYVARWRMHVACRLLKEGRLRVDQIAGSLGYESQAAFSRAFKKHLGVSPATWRAQEAA